MKAQYRADREWIKIGWLDIHNVMTFYAWESWFQPGPHPKPWLGAWLEVSQ